MSFAAPLQDPAYAALREALRNRGYVEGQDIRIEFRNAQGYADRLPALANELIQLPANVIVVGNTAAAWAVKRATSSIPIVMASVDPVAAGLATSLAHPGGNLTGVSNMTADLVSKRLQLLREMIPGLRRIAVLWQELTPTASKLVEDITTVAPTLSIEVKAVKVRTPDDIPNALAEISRANVQALYIVESPLFYGHRSTLAAAALKARLPAMYGTKVFAQDGGLMAYGADIVDQARRAAGYVDRILRGDNPGELPIEQPNKFELVINLKTAKALGIRIPESILLRADEVIR